MNQNNHKKLLSTTKEILKLFSLPKGVAGLLVNGSIAWGNTASVHNQSDIDLDIILEQDFIIAPKEMHKIHRFNEFINHTNQLFQDHQADYASFKFDWAGRKIGLHIVPFLTFNNVCSHNFQSTQRTICLKEYRLQPKDKKPIYLQRNFMGKFTKFKCLVEKTKIGRITHTPLAIIKNQLYYNGLLPDKYLTYPVAVADNPNVYLLLNQLKVNLCQRLIYEKEMQLVDASANLGNLLHARQRVPQCEVEHLAIETRLVENLIL